MTRIAPRARPLAVALLLALASAAQAQSLAELFEAARGYDATYLAARSQYEANLARAQQAKAEAQLAQAQALLELADTRGQLDGIALSLINTINAAQANGVDLDGNAGQPLFAGSDAASMTMVAASGRAIATASAGSPAGSRDVGNLNAMRSALSAADPAGEMDTLLFGISSAVAGRTVTRDALDSIAGTAKIALQAQAGVDLDNEAMNLVRFQQAFQANGRVMQVAADIFDSILSIR